MKNISLLILLLCSTGYLPAQQLYRFEKNGKYGFKNAAGKIIVKPIYNYASDSVTSLGGVCNNNNWAVINNYGELLTGFKYTGGVGNAKGFDLVPVYNSSGFMGVNHYYGIVNKAGSEVAPPHYSSVEIISNELAIVDDYGKYGIINAASQPVLPLQFSKETLKIFTNIQPNGAYYENGQWKAFSFDGNTIKKWKYDDIILEGEYLWPVKYRNKWGFVDTLGRELISLKYDSVGIYTAGVAWVSVAGKKGVIDNKGTLVIPVQYDGVFKDETGNYLVYANGKCGLADKQGRQLVPVKYNYIHQFKEDLAAVQLDKKWGFVDLAGKEVIVPMYDGVLPFSDGLAAIVRNNKVGFINKAGSLVIEPQFDDVVESFYKGRAIVVKNGKEIYIEKNGQEVK